MKKLILTTLCATIFALQTLASYTVTIPGGFSFYPIANHLVNPAGNDLNTLLPGVPDGTQIFKWNCALADFDPTVPTYAASPGQWFPNGTLDPGEGAFIVNAGPAFNVTFTGTPVTPTMPSTNYCGCDTLSFLSSQTATVASWESLVGAPPTAGAMFMRWDVNIQDFVTNTFTGCQWTLGIPSADIGESVKLFVPCVTNTVPCPCAPPPSGMSAWWPFDETAGLVANDTAGAVNNLGTDHGLPLHAAGAVSNALCFASTNDFVVVSNHAEINFSGNCTNGAESFTIDAWIRADVSAAGLETILDKRVNSGGIYGYSVYLSNGRLGCQIGDGTFQNYGSPGPDLRDGQWHFIAWTLERCDTNGNAGTLYVDGSVVSTFLDPRTGDLNNSSDLFIGQRNPVFGENHFRGCIDELEFFKRALTAAELQAIYNAGSVGKCKTVSTGCCNTNVTVCITNIIQPGVQSYLANNLCNGTNTFTTLSALFPNPPPNTVVQLFNCGFTTYVFDDIDLVWAPNDPTVSLGQGFVITIPQGNPPFTWIRCGNLPTCPPPCLPTNCCVLVGKRGPGAGTWNDLSSCPPTCGTEVQVWTGTGFLTHTYTLSGWSPFAPVLPQGHAAWVCRNLNVNCNPCTNNLVVSCPTNKMVDCASVWAFDEPTAVSPCCGTNVTIGVAATWTNGLCPTIATRIWQITDCLTNTSTCTQAVVIVDSTPPTFSVCITNRITVGGATDDFAGLEPASPSSGLVTRLNNAGVVNFRGFDDCALNRYFAHTFANLPGCITEARLTVRLRACGGAANDSIGFSFTDAGGNLVTNAGTWGRYLGSGNPATGLTNVPWNSGATLLLQLDLSNLPNADGSFTDLLPFLNANGFLDFTVQDDTAVDFAILDITSCCCNTNITVNCGDEWGFAAPIVSDNCCTNPTASVVNAFTNGPCPQVITWIWLASDCCGNSNMCIRQITVRDTVAPEITCATNKTVECGSLWSFDPPTGTDTCSPPISYQLIASNFVSATPCQKTFQGIWQVWDACTNVSTCTQTVTTVDTTPPMLSVCVTNRISVGGLTDDFSGIAPAFPSAGMVTRLNNAGVFNLKQFDDCSTDTYFAHTITNLPGCITSARLRVRLRACGGGSANDGIGISFTDTNGVAQTNAWSSYIGNGNPGNAVTNTPWNAGTTVELLLDLSALPTAGGPVNLLPQLNANGFLDFAVQDDTAVDYLVLELVSCCCGDELTVECGDPLGFATPIVSDACCAVTYSGVNSVTNGSCPQVITMTWWAADCCGNTNTCTRQITVVDTKPPAVNCPLPIGVLCGNPVIFGTPTAVDACSGTNVSITIVQTTTNGTACNNNLTRTWLITDPCGNSTMCSQTITVADVVAPELHCPKNITRVICGSSVKVYYKAWAKDACSPPVTLTYNPPSGSTFFAGTTTPVTVIATDACGNTNVCGFNVTVKDKRIWQWFYGGVHDCFKYPYDSVVRSSCLNSAYPFGPWKPFDDKTPNRRFGYSWQSLPAGIFDAQLYTRMRPNCLFQSPQDDTLHLGLNACNAAGWFYTRNIGTLVGGTWCGQGGCGVPFTFGLTNLPLGGGSLLSHINTTHRLDMLVQDDTAVDYAWLRALYCPPNQIVGGLGTTLNNAIIANSWNSWCLAKDPLVTATNYSASFNLGAGAGAKMRLDLSHLVEASNAVIQASLRRELSDGSGSNSVGLRISNIGTQGQDGVSITFAASAPFNGSRLVLRLQGVTQLDQSFGPGVLPPSMTCSNLGSSGQDGVSFAVSNIGSSGQDGVSLVVANIGSSGQDGVLFSGSFGSVLADEIKLMVLDAPVTDLESSSRFIDIEVLEVSEIGLSSLALELNGTAHTADDDSLAHVSGGRFVVSSIVDPTDGQHDDLTVAQLSVAPTNELRISLGTSFGEITPAVSNASLTLITRGIAGGVERDAHAIHIFSGGWPDDHCAVMLSNGVPVTPALIQVWNGVDLVANVTNPASIHLTAMPPVHWPSVTWFVDADICHRLPYNDPVIVTVNGIAYPGTEVRILEGLNQFTALTGERVEARLSDVLSLSPLATGAETYRLQIPNLGSSGQDGVMIQWDGLGGVLRDAANVFGPWTSVSNGVGGEVTVPNGGEPVRVFRVQSP